MTTYSLQFLQHSNPTKDSALICDDALFWYSRSSMLSGSSISEKNITYLASVTNTYYDVTHTCSSTCGNVCYADATTTGSSVFITTITDYDIETVRASYTGIRPNCTVPLSSCSSLWQAYSSRVDNYNSWAGGLLPVDAPEPNIGRDPNCKLNTKCPGCYIMGGGKLQLYYWPVPQTVSRDMCADFPDQRLRTAFQSAGM